MKSILIAFLIGLAFVGCSKEAEHSLRISNELNDTVNRVRLGEVRYENLAPASISTYNTVVEGDYVLTALISGQPYVFDPITIKGNKGEDKWQLRIESYSKISLIEEPL